MEHGGGFVFNTGSILVKYDNVHHRLIIIIESAVRIEYYFWDAKATYLPLSNANLIIASYNDATMDIDAGW